jgi:hypothetical protein
VFDAPFEARGWGIIKPGNTCKTFFDKKSGKIEFRQNLSSFNALSNARGGNVWCIFSRE